MTEPVYSSGVTTSTFMIGSSRTEPPFCRASRNAAREAISKASTDESTSWKAPSISVALTSTTGKPARTPAPMTLLMPFSTPGTYSFGTAPPTILDSNTLPAPGLVRLEDDLDAGELARAAGLLLVGVVLLDPAGQLLAIGHLRRADIGVDLVGAAQDVDLDVEMELAHPLEDGLAGLLIGRHAEGRVLGRELRQRHAQLLLVGLGLRLDGDLDDRLGELHLLEDHGLLQSRTACRRCGCPSGRRARRCRPNRLP